MPDSNAALRVVQDDDPLDLGDLIPRTKTITITRDGKKAHIEAFVFTTAPVSIYATIAQAHDEYMAVVQDESTFGVHRDQAQSKYYAAVARALTDNVLTPDEADRLGGDYPKVSALLRALEYLKPTEAVPAGEGSAAGSISESSSPTSEPSTAATTPTG